MENITANGISYKCHSVTTGTTSISFTMEGQDIGDIRTAFQDVTHLTVSGEGDVYGSYENLLFESATVYADGKITVTMHIPIEMELRLADLEATQAEQDEVIAGLMYGGEV